MAATTDKIARRIASIAAARPVLDAPPIESQCQRIEQRFPVYRPGRIALAGGAEIDCMIVDSSVNGARVQLRGAESLPDFVTLKVLSSGMKRRARVAWRRENAAGLSFRVEQATTFGGGSRN